MKKMSNKLIVTALIFMTPAFAYAGPIGDMIDRGGAVLKGIIGLLLIASVLGGLYMAITGLLGLNTSQQAGGANSTPLQNWSKILIGAALVVVGYLIGAIVFELTGEDQAANTFGYIEHVQPTSIDMAYI